MIKFLNSQQRWIPTTQSPLANCGIWLCDGDFFSSSSPGWPVFPLKPEQTENNRLWWADQRSCSRTSPSGACPRCDTHRLPLAVSSTMDCRPRGAACHLFSPIHLRENAKVMLTPPPKGEQNKEQTDGHKWAPRLLQIYRLFDMFLHHACCKVYIELGLPEGENNSLIHHYWRQNYWNCAY